jgi:RNA polymerase sigma-70 factor, ECF subfamily
MQRHPADIENPLPPHRTSARREGLHRYLASLRRYARGLAGNDFDADDLAQETVKRVLERLDGWDDLRNLRAYLFATLRNLHVELRRRDQRHGIEVPLDQADGALVVPPMQIARLELWEVVRALADLPEAQRETIASVGVEGMSYEDVAAQSSVPVGTVMSRLHRGRCALRRALGRPAAGRDGQDL